MKKIIGYAILLFLVWCVVMALKPYWDRYWFERELEAVAIYGTKNSIGETRDFLHEKIKEQGRNLKGEDFVLEKDENNTVTVSITYDDEISIFGKTLKQLEFTINVTAKEIESSY